MFTLLLTLLAPDSVSPRPDQRPYWQQRVAYDISARLEEPLGLLRGSQRIQYVNNSPDTLRTFAVHLHLNAFRPGSEWAARDSIEGRRRFNDLKDPNYAFNHVANVQIMGTPVLAQFPYAPDSTIARFDLPRPLAPGDSMIVTMDWDARLSTVPRRQGRRGRQFDFAHSYPKVVVYDRFGWNENRLIPAGEFYGEFATYRVELEVPEDQVMGATGVPVCGDPGWVRANQAPGREVEYGVEAYPGVQRQLRGGEAGEGGRRGPGAGCGFTGFPANDLPAGYKRVLWYAEDVHHFAFSLNPDYRYEGARAANKQTLIHVLYRPGDEKEWGNGVAVQRTAVALGWLENLFGPFAWPQITNLHRLDGGGTEFPMVIMDGSASQGLILHELGHNYTMGILANNEWREGFLDEGFTSFQTTWFFEEASRRAGGQASSGAAGVEAGILELDLDEWSEPTSLRADRYSDFIIYNQMIYSRGELFYHQLRHIVGDDTMREILRTYYARWKLKHVDEEAFRAVAEEVSQQDLSGFFGQWLHGTVLYDYAVGKVGRRLVGDGTTPGRQDGRTPGRLDASTPGQGAGWITRVEVVRLEDGMMPVDVVVIAQGDTGVARTDGMARRAWVEVPTRTEPREVLLDPGVQAHDWNMLNNRYRFRFLGKRSAPRHDYLDTWFSEPESRDRIERGWMPVAWYNDAGGLTVGIRSRSNYLGRFNLDQFMVSYGTGVGSDLETRNLDFFLRLKNPPALRAPRQSQRFEAFKFEGRWGGLLGWSAWSQEHLTFGPRWTQDLSLQLVNVSDTRFLDPGQWEDVGIAELVSETSVRTRSGRWQLTGRLNLGGGVAFAPGGQAESREGVTGFFFRGEVEGTARRQVASKLELGLRAYGGFGGGKDLPAKQLQIYVGSSDPIQQLNNPFLRSQGALLVRDDVAYQAPGGANVRAVDFRVSSLGLVAANLELERTLRRKPNGKLFNRVMVAAFGDAAQGFGDEVQPVSGEALRFIADAGLGVRANHKIGQTSFVTRFDFPFYLSAPEFARNDFARQDAWDFRWLFSVEAAF